MKRIVLASGNLDKLKEIREMLPDYEIVLCKDLGFTGEIEETGKTFYENALIKAKTVSESLNVDALADDSGICVEALGGAPGIYSARYSVEGDSAHNNALLIKNMQGKTDRRAKYVCCMVIYHKDGKIVSATGETKGKLLETPIGTNGFGYDPFFFSDDLDKPMGLATSKEKNSVSHRFRAIEKLKEELSK